jgi:transcriptional regulator with XRE-family HTH domain
MLEFPELESRFWGMSESFGAHLEDLVKAKNLTLLAFAERVRKPKGTISRICGGTRTPNLDDAKKWADEFDLSGKSRQRFLDLAAIAHLPKEAQSRFHALLERLERLEATAESLRKR